MHDFDLIDSVEMSKLRERNREKIFDNQDEENGNSEKS